MILFASLITLECVYVVANENARNMTWNVRFHEFKIEYAVNASECLDWRAREPDRSRYLKWQHTGIT